ncbi:phospholipase effector Tle1 domain-containing protein [Marinobacter sp. HN1S83]|uniref:phospholipase effector Tle1 domain-containing protein n=1 Tax=Marinobacter sp. HN1S83 TaxID=3382301 RepID=UPI00387A8FCF
MQLKRSMDLTPYDIPRIESPFLAASETRRKINAGQFREHDLRRLLRLQPYGRVDLCELAVKLVASGGAFLVHGPMDEGPLSPVVAWRSSPEQPNGGEWRPTGQLPFGLSYPLQDLNSARLTPQDIKRGPFAPGSGSPTPRQRPETDESQPHRPQQASSTIASTASVMTTTIAGIKAAEDTESQEEKEPEVHVEVGIFTDGTLNNAFNTQQMQNIVDDECITPLENNEIDEIECERRLGLIMGASYTNTRTNVAKLSDLYPEDEVEQDGIITIRVKAYAPGPGSKTGSDDSLFGAATGLGETGIINQVEKAFQEISSQLPTRLRGRQIKSLSADIFGFSRGSASARHAANEISLGNEGIFASLLKKSGVKPPSNLEVRFVGLFDCVAAIVNPIAGDLKPHNNRNNPVKMFLDSEKIQSAVHLTANHEHRKLFALNSLKNPDGSLPTNFREIALPGAHSDIGGGYPESHIEEVLVSPLYPIPRNRHRWPEQTVQWDNLKTMRKKIEAEGWIGDYSLPLDGTHAGANSNPSLEIVRRYRPHPSPDGHMEIALRMVRKIKAGYSRVTLRMMHELASSSRVPFHSIDPTDPILRIPDELSPVYESLGSQVSMDTDCPTLSDDHMDLVLQRYVHYSAHYNSFETLIAGQPTRIQLFRNMRPNAPSSSRERVVHPNLEND